MSDREEQELLEAARHGDPAAVQRLVEAHYDPLYRFLWRLTSSPDAAAELTQETFVRALERLRSFRGAARFSTWLHAVALNLWRDAGRRRRWESAAPVEEAPAAECEHEALTRLEQHEVRRAVERLPEPQRVAILLFYYEGMSHQEIARVCGCPVGTVGTRVFHGLRALRRLETAEGPEKRRLTALQSGAAWAAAQLYQRLTGAQRLALANGEALEFKTGAAQPDQHLPAEWGARLSSGSLPLIVGAAPDDRPPAVSTLGLQIDRSELGQLSLKYRLGLSAGQGMISMEPHDPLALGQSPSVAKPDNAGANRALRSDARFQQVVSLKPRPSCPRFAANARPPAAESAPVLNSLGEPGPEPPHVSTADVWEAVHQKTGLPVIADAYSRFYPVDRVTIEPPPLFEVLNRLGEALGVRWRKEGDFLLCRSTSAFWDRLKEVPNRYLARWQQDRRGKDGLPFDDFLEMASLSDQQLDSEIVGRVIEHCWGVEEWGMIGSGPARLATVLPRQLRPFARFAAALTPDQRRQAQQADWLAADALKPAQQEALARALQPFGIPPQYLAGLRLRYDYFPAGWYVRALSGNSPQREEALKLPAVAGPTQEAALAAARRLDPNISSADIHRSPGIFALVFRFANGRIWEIGWPMGLQ